MIIIGYFKIEKMKRKKYLILVFPLLVLGVLALPQTIAAQGIDEHMTIFEDIDEVPKTDLMDVIGNVIQWVLGFLGLIATIFIIVGGFQWMTSAGDEEKIAKAKKLMTNGIIGLVIVLLAYILANFIIGAIQETIYGEV